VKSVSEAMVDDEDASVVWEIMSEKFCLSVWRKNECKVFVNDP
jgi:hypothetical protein